ncbi:MAG: polymerase sigma factor RpoE [Myxococcaceae bacterium]|nr:polymerase sigma factor RpoE [Myxococcaceae bacterium]
MAVRRAAGRTGLIATRQEHDSTPEQPPRLRQLYEEHASFVCRSLRRLGVMESDLDDLLQEVFLVVYQRLSDYQERDRARSWLYSISVRVAQGQRRRMFRRRENLTSQPPEGQAPAGQLQAVEEREALQLGQRLLGLLPAEQREVFVLYEVEDMPMSQIAEAVGCPLQTAYSRLYKARERIVDELARTRVEGESR